jgi:RNA polymerase sigma factor (sigma-70 family)
MAGDRDALGQIRILFGGGTTGGLTDGELLERFLAGDGQAAESAFAALVERHGPMVLRVARSMLRDPHDSEDAVQATFLVLARKAGSLRVVDSLGPWLHGVTCRVAARVRTAAIRRRSKERRAVEDTPTPSRDRADDLGSALDEEIGRLPDRYRAAVVLCLLEGLTQEQAAYRLGWPSGTVRSRLARGRELLRGRLIRRGLAPSAALLGACAATEAIAAPLSESATRAAMAYRSGSLSTETASASVRELASKVSGSLSMSRVKVAAMLCLAACIGAAGVRVFARQDPGVRPAAKAEPAKAPTVRWRYQSVRFINEAQLVDVANEESAKGWEVVEVVPIIHGMNGSIGMQYTILFRRAADAED